jgi:hypothetical protein
MIAGASDVVQCFKPMPDDRPAMLRKLYAPFALARREIQLLNSITSARTVRVAHSSSR